MGAKTTLVKKELDVFTIELFNKATNDGWMTPVKDYLMIEVTSRANGKVIESYRVPTERQGHIEVKKWMAKDVLSSLPILEQRDIQSWHIDKIGLHADIIRDGIEMKLKVTPK